VALAAFVLAIGGWAASEYQLDNCTDRAVAAHPIGPTQGEGTIWDDESLLPDETTPADRLAARRKAMDRCSRWPI